MDLIRFLTALAVGVLIFGVYNLIRIIPKLFPEAPPSQVIRWFFMLLPFDQRHWPTEWQPGRITSPKLFTAFLILSWASVTAAGYLIFYLVFF